MEFYADAAMSTCNIADLAPTLVQVHMFQMGTLPTDFFIFAAYTPACWVGAIWLGDAFATNLFGIGGGGTHSEYGVLIYHSECVQPPVYLGYMSFFTSGQGLPCCKYAAQATSRDDAFVVHECGTDFTYRPLSARPAIINGNANCPCELPVSTVETTWGRVKALYR